MTPHPACLAFFTAAILSEMDPIWLTLRRRHVHEAGDPVRNYDAIAQDVVERTGLLVIDYGGGEMEGAV